MGDESAATSARERLLAIATMTWASVLVGDAIIAGFVPASDPTLRVGYHVACGLSTLGFTIGLLDWYFRRPRSLGALLAGTFFAASLNASLCATLTERNPTVAPFVLTIGAFVWGPVAMLYFGGFSVFVRGLRTVEAIPSRDRERRLALLCAAWLVGIGAAYRALSCDAASPHGTLVFLLVAPAILLGLGVLVRDLRDLAWLSRVAAGREPRFELRALTARDEERRPLPWVAFLAPPSADWAIVETSTTGEGPFREHRTSHPRFTLERGAAPLRRRMAATALVLLAAFSLCVSVGA